MQVLFALSWMFLFMQLYLGDTGGTPHYNAYFGAGTGPIYLDDVACTLSASQLLECSSRPILVHNCDHHADAGVGCEGKISSLKTLVNTNITLVGFSNVLKLIVASCKSGQLLFKVESVNNCNMQLCRTMHNWSSAIKRR